MALLEKLWFVHFDKYTVVGNNSGPNQSALFTGFPLVGGREGIKSSTSHVEHDNGADGSPQWLWDELLGNAGYATTLKTEDICIENSNMVQSIKPNISHGKQMYQMFCFDFDRPHCLGKDMAAKHLLMTYAQQFMKSYGDDDSKLWATMLSFVDSHEDAMTLIGYLDKNIFVEVLEKVDFDNTFVVFSSDHGLHYGPSFASNGERERAEPILYIHAPPSLHKSQLRNLDLNKNLWVTPFDVHETILDATLQKTNVGMVGSSLFKPLHIAHDRKKCRTTPGIPENFCSILSTKKISPKGCTLMAEPPSVHSFYADIERANRPSWPKCDEVGLTVAQEESCRCSANTGLPCNSTKFQVASPERNTDPLRMKTCRRDASHNTSPLSTASTNYTMEINITITRRPSFLERAEEAKYTFQNGGEKKNEPLPNILFIQIDSLSQSASKRHMPKTLALFNAHRIVKNEDQALYCPTGFCAVMFNKTSIVGQNSIPNQLAALSGCTDRKLTGVDSYNRDPVNDKTPLEVWCPEQNDLDNPWLFDLAPKLGYVTYFGEEFCFSRSPWVIQRNLFDDNSDYQMKDLFCN